MKLKSEAFGLLFIVTLTAGAGNMALQSVLPAIGREFGLADTLVAFAFVLEALDGVPDADDQLLVTALYGLSAAIFSAGIASLYALMTHAYPPSCRSAGIGFGIFVGRVGAVAATGLGGWLIDLGEGSLVPFFAVLAVSAVLMSSAAFVVDRHVPPARSRLGGA